MAGFYESYVNFKGEVRLEAKSLSFDKMNEEEFAQVYKGFLDVVWTRILKSKGYETPEKIDAYVNELLRYEQ